MPIVEDYLKQKKEAEKKGREAAGQEGAEEVKGPTLKELLKNNEQSRFFGAYLKERGEDALAEKLASQEELSESDYNHLSGQRGDFVHLLETVGKMSEKLNVKNIEELAATSPDLKKFKDLVGSEGIRDALVRNLEEMAIHEPERIKKIGDQFAQLEATKKEFTEKNKEIADILKEYDLSEAEYREAILSGDQEALDDFVKDRMGMWAKLKLKFSDDAMQKFRDEVDSIDKSKDIEALGAQLDGDMKDLGGILQATLVGNQAVNKALADQLRQRKPEQVTPDMSFPEMNEIMDKRSVKKAWERFETEYRDDYVENGVYNEEEARRDFAQGYARNATKKRKGIWTTIIGAVLAVNVVEDILKG